MTERGRALSFGPSRPVALPPARPFCRHCLQVRPRSWARGSVRFVCGRGLLTITVQSHWSRVYGGSMVDRVPNRGSAVPFQPGVYSLSVSIPGVEATLLTVVADEGPVRVMGLDFRLVRIVRQDGSTDRCPLPSHLFQRVL